MFNYVCFLCHHICGEIKLCVYSHVSEIVANLLWSFLNGVLIMQSIAASSNNNRHRCMDRCGQNVLGGPSNHAVDMTCGRCIPTPRRPLKLYTSRRGNSRRHA